MNAMRGLSNTPAAAAIDTIAAANASHA